MADLFTFELRSGTVLRYTSADISLTINGIAYSALGPLIERGSTSTSVGLDVDVLDMTIHATSTDLVDGVPFTRAALTGAFDGAEVTLDL